ncbi:Chromatin structure remodeling complex protein sfh1 [Malassezia yamatoensis]|uniref:Chromatin structure remodeling complex protein sfh1 n=1 Tax=Malassezia yamatoensis TaxID=253288 RepID=A0AAJ6CFR9_9BASI|nr:Chromatin structure remodeling complex protein sfh1 [Malassezia yamatoensis]
MDRGQRMRAQVPYGSPQAVGHAHAGAHAGLMAANGAGWVLGTGSEPMLPQAPIAKAQAMYSTYASQLRAGTTTLMQPIQRNAQYDHVDRSERGDHRGRYANAVYYGEDASDDDEDGNFVDEEYDASNKRRRSGTGDARSTNSPDAHTALDVEGEAELRPPGSQLGLPVPRNRLLVRPARRTMHQYFSESQLVQNTCNQEVLVPVRIEFHTETHRIKDVFLWNLHERLITPYQFAQIFLQDLALPLTPYAVQIESLIIQQLADAIPLLDDADVDGVGRITDMKASTRERKRVEADAEAQRRKSATHHMQLSDTLPERRRRGRPRKSNTYADTVGSAHSRNSPPRGSTYDASHRESPAEEKEASVQPSDPKSAEKSRVRDALASVDAEDDLRVIVDVRYEVQILRYILRDRLEWDMTSNLSPEDFAYGLTRDLGLSTESTVLISHAVREQLLRHRRAALELGLFGSGKVYRCTMDELVEVYKLEQAEIQAASEQETSMDAAAVGDHAQRQAAEAASTLESDVTPRDDNSEIIAPPNTRSRRIAAGAAAAESSPSAPFLVPDKTLPLAVRKEQALATLRDLLALGPRPLEDVWRDFHEASDFGPLLEFLSEAEMEKMEEADLRASRYVPTLLTFSRNRRDAQRAGRTRR